MPITVEKYFREVSSMGTHALITTYNETQKSNLPLILIVGREPNNEGRFVTATGTYDFDNARRCAFWNESYAVVGKLAGMNGQNLKSICRTTNTSPIAFSDISPVLIRNNDPEMRKKRKNITLDQIDTHIKNILSLTDALDRTAVVILTGHRSGSLSKQAKETFGYGASQLEAGLKFRKVASISVPFMYGNNQAKILERIRADKIVQSKITATIDTLMSEKQVKAA